MWMPWPPALRRIATPFGNAPPELDGVILEDLHHLSSDQTQLIGELVGEHRLAGSIDAIDATRTQFVPR